MLNQLRFLGKVWLSLLLLHVEWKIWGGVVVRRATSNHPTKGQSCLEFAAHSRDAFLITEVRGGKEKDRRSTTRKGRKNG